MPHHAPDEPTVEVRCPSASLYPPIKKSTYVHEIDRRVGLLKVKLAHRKLLAQQRISMEFAASQQLQKAAPRTMLKRDKPPPPDPNEPFLKAFLAFGAADRDADINAAEFGRGLASLKLKRPLLRATVLQIFASYDASHDGLIDFLEFKQFCKEVQLKETQNGETLVLEVNEEFINSLCSRLRRQALTKALNLLN